MGLKAIITSYSICFK